jgi:hypothetical protein
VPEGSVFPLVVFAANHDRINGLDGTMLVDSCSIAVQCWADPAEAERLLGWKAMLDLDRMCEDAWRWQSANPTGYRG